jgi:hypothetical protein
VASGAKDDIMVIALDLLVLNSSVVWREQYDWSVKGCLSWSFNATVVLLLSLLFLLFVSIS